MTMFIAADSPDLDSPSGNQEDNLARTLNNHLMTRASNGTRHDWDNPRYVGGAPEHALRMIRAYVRCRARHAPGVWGVKDPRMCFTLEPWVAATKDLPVRWILIRRERRQSTVASLTAMLPAKLRLAGEPDGLQRLASTWAESYQIALELGLERTGLRPYSLTYEELLSPEGQRRLAEHFAFAAPLTSVVSRLNRRGRASQ
ncbi:hypothetical protein POL68_17450 [Stigmatella sp. ncwal1]|uniref:Transposase n=1 Tax=Stigmatella ashevillensis TaxID=2995309 RepID=A0ABT5DD64_9BACT|nr:hypothetical protein [Stigmatella ashevillena]MDC0710267.1 hypothetical protein [Stigmatella ashevillena]